MMIPHSPSHDAHDPPLLVASVLTPHDPSPLAVSALAPHNAPPTLVRRFCPRAARSPHNGGNIWRTAGLPSVCPHVARSHARRQKPRTAGRRLFPRPPSRHAILSPHSSAASALAPQDPLPAGCSLGRPTSPPPPTRERGTSTKTQRRM